MIESTTWKLLETQRRMVGATGENPLRVFWEFAFLVSLILNLLHKSKPPSFSTASVLSPITTRVLRRRVSITFKDAECNYPKTFGGFGLPQVPSILVYSFWPWQSADFS